MQVSVYLNDYITEKVLPKPFWLHNSIFQSNCYDVKDCMRGENLSTSEWLLNANSVTVFYRQNRCSEEDSVVCKKSAKTWNDTAKLKQCPLNSGQTS